MKPPTSKDVSASVVFEAACKTMQDSLKQNSADPPLIPCPVCKGDSRVYLLLPVLGISCIFVRKKILLGSRYTMDHHDGIKKFEI